MSCLYGFIYIEWLVLSWFVIVGVGEMGLRREIDLVIRMDLNVGFGRYASNLFIESGSFGSLEK